MRQYAVSYAVTPENLANRGLDVFRQMQQEMARSLTEQILKDMPLEQEHNEMTGVTRFYCRINIDFVERRHEKVHHPAYPDRPGT